MDDNVAQESFLLAAKFVELAFVGNLINQVGSDAAVVVCKQSPPACGTLSELRPALLADNMARRTLRYWELSGDIETHWTS